MFSKQVNITPLKKNGKKLSDAEYILQIGHELNKNPELEIRYSPKAVFYCKEVYRLYNQKQINKQDIAEDFRLRAMPRH